VVSNHKQGSYLESSPKRGTSKDLAYMCCVKKVMMNHLLISCECAKQVWVEIENTSRFRERWKGYSIVDYLKHWFVKKKLEEFKALPIISLWGIQISRSTCIFKGKSIPMPIKERLY
jgi:hypothetical protein